MKYEKLLLQLQLYTALVWLAGITHGDWQNCRRCSARSMTNDDLRAKRLDAAIFHDQIRDQIPYGNHISITLSDVLRAIMHAAAWSRLLWKLLLFTCPTHGEKACLPSVCLSVCLSAHHMRNVAITFILTAAKKSDKFSDKTCQNLWETFCCKTEYTYLQVFV